MSTRPGSHQKKKPGQKHKNVSAFKFDKYRTDPQAKSLKSLQVVNCCPKCTSVIEWKIKYGKYKMLTTPAKCVDCLQKVVKHNYHIRCEACVIKSGKCAKCGESVEEFVNTVEPSQTTLARQEADFQRDLKCLPERKRRAFLRYLERLQSKLRKQHIYFLLMERWTFFFAACEEGYDSEEAKQKLRSLVDKFGKENDEDFDFDDLNIEEDFSSEEENGWPGNSFLYYFWNKKHPQPTSSVEARII